jgi:hypothetical protein
MQSNATGIERLAKGGQQHRWRIGRQCGCQLLSAVLGGGAASGVIADGACSVTRLVGISGIVLTVIVDDINNMMAKKQSLWARRYAFAI